MPHWLIVVSWVSVIAGFATAGIVTLDVIRHPQRMKIMNVVWPVTCLYFPLLGIWFYHLMGRPMAADAPSVKLDQPHWKRIFLSATHCGSGCVIGDVLGPPIVFGFGLTLLGTPLLAEYVAEFAFAYAFGIAFQYFPIRWMSDVSPLEALLDAVKADTLSLIAFEVGMFGWMAIAYFILLPEHPTPLNIVFWFMMQIGMILGFMTTYPANWLLIKWGIKQGM
jgi:Domain of unknown function (DUF4396)